MKQIAMTCFLWLGLASSALAQTQSPTIGLEEATLLALEYNYDVRIAQLNEEVAAERAVPGEAGFLPTVSLTGSGSYAENGTYLEFADPSQPVIEADAAATTNYSAALNVNYVLYNGGGRRVTLKQLENSLEQSGMLTRQRMEGTVLSVSGGYLAALAAWEVYQINQETAQLSVYRYQRAKENYALGNYTKLELLNAEVDLSTDSSNVIQSRLAYEKALVSLNQLIGIAPDSVYVLDTELVFNGDLQLGNLLNDVLSRNTGYLLTRKQLEASALQVDQARTGYMPQLSFTGGYSLSGSLNEAALFAEQRSNGWNAGLQLSYNLYNGGRTKRAQQTAIIQQQAQELAVQQSEDLLRTNLISTYKDYTTNLELMTLSERNVELAQANYDRSEVGFGTGQVTGLQLREAQNNLARAKYQLTSQRIQTKQAELSLYFYSGSLVE
ncbi:MAG: TolC family protein [Bacteroidota bacterium]